MNYFQKTRKSLPWVMVFLISWFALYFQPWVPPFNLSSSEASHVELVFRKRNGDFYNTKISLQPNVVSPVFAGMELISLKTSSPTDLVFHVRSQTYKASIESYRKIPSERNYLWVQISIGLVSIILSWLCYLFAQIFFSKKKAMLKISGVWLLHFTILMMGFISAFPGYFNFDSFENYVRAASYNPGFFPGYFYSLILISLYQLFPVPYLVPILSILVVSMVLTYFYFVAFKNKAVRPYVIVTIFFYVFPVHWAMNLTVNRDTIAHWILGLSLIMLYHFLVTNERRPRLLITLTVFLNISCLLRQEMIFFLPVILIFICWKWKRELLKWSTLSAISMFLTWGTFNFLPNLEDRHIDRYIYQTTVLINPLGSILTSLYGETLPEKINSELGPYFKNELLVKEHQEYEIMPFHLGGLKELTPENYEQFKSAAINIFLNNPLLFLKNRMNIMLYMYGFKPVISFYSDEFDNNEGAFYEMKRSIGFKPKRPLNGSSYLTMFMLHMQRSPVWVYRSYIIPILMLLICCLFPSAIWYRRICLFLLARSLLVILTSPGGYLKYNYILWIFALFALPLFVSERRTGLDKNTSKA